MTMKTHHKQAIDRLVDSVKDDPDFLAVIVGGSIAKGVARDNSDVDVYLVITDEAHARCKAEDRLFYFNRDFCDYPGGYIDGKLVKASFVEDAAERGSEPTRYSFTGSRVAYSKIPGLEEVVRRIPVYPEQNRERNLQDFYAQVLLYGNYFAPQAIDQGNRYMLAYAAANLVLFASRMILAHNRMLFPCHKSLGASVAIAPDKPDGFERLALEVLEEPTKDRIRALVDAISKFRDWGIDYGQAVSRFMEINEWNWIDAPPPIYDR